MNNMPKVKIGIVAVSRDCFPESLSVNRRKALVEAYTKKYDAEEIYECPICIVESEIHMVQALEDIKKAGCNALAVYLGNFGPEISETLLAKHFDGPKMFLAAAEESGDNLVQGRGEQSRLIRLYFSRSQIQSCLLMAWKTQSWPLRIFPLPHFVISSVIWNWMKLLLPVK